MDKFFRFQPIYKNKLWGGRRLEKFGRILPEGKIGESWEISDFGSDTSVVSLGNYQGVTLRELLAVDSKDILGEPFKLLKQFPLLVKIIDAEDKLSVQVHPDSDYSLKMDPSNPAKKEAWIILDASSNASIVCGFKNKTYRFDYEKKVRSNLAEEDLRNWQTRSGDCFLINPGTIHAIGAGNLILEIQESSDSTYRVYDYGRLDDSGKPRELHLEKALDVLNFEKSNGEEYLKPKTISSENCIRNIITHNDKFIMQTLEFNGELVLPSIHKEPTFQIISVIEGNVMIEDSEILMPTENILVTAFGLKEGIKISSKSKAKLILSSSSIV